MTINQCADVRAWHLGHRGHRLEFHVWNLVMTLWVLGWVGLPAAVVLHLGAAAAAAFTLLGLPSVYVRLRGLLHRRGWLRCDWLAAIRR